MRPCLLNQMLTVRQIPTQSGGSSRRHAREVFIIAGINHSKIKSPGVRAIPVFIYHCSSVIHTPLVMLNESLTITP